MIMIKKLRRRMTILVSVVLILVTAGIVFFINYMNWRNIASQAENALKTLAENSGIRPGLPEDRDENDPGAPGNRDENDPGAPGNRDENDPGAPGNRSADDPGASADGAGEGSGSETAVFGEKPPDSGQPPQIRDALATMSNYYVVTLAEDGSIDSWTSDRSFLYSEEQVQEMTSMALAKGADSGRIGTQFYTFAKPDGKRLLIVLDERLEVMAAGRVLRVSALIAAIACLLLCVGAYFLIGFMVRPVQEAFDRQRQFVWDASHELKTPLAVIGTNAQALQGEIGENESLTYILDEVQLTDRMIRNLLTLARMDKGSEKAQLKTVDLGNTVLGAVLPLESTAFDEGRTITCDVGEQVLCRGDEDMLRQLTVILLSNALKYSDEGSTIRVQADKKGRTARLMVSNTGDGIAPEDLEKIFERFYRGDASHNSEVEGHGLGLAIAKNIVDMHGGRIQVTSEPAEKGRYLTTFTVTLQAV